MVAPVGGSSGGGGVPDSGLAAEQALLDKAIQELAIVLIRNPQEERLAETREEANN